MAKISEETTKGLVAEKLKNISGYPSAQNTKVDGITWFKEDSYKGTAYDWLAGVFAKASKKQTLKSKGTPDFIVAKDGSETIVIIECKGDVKNQLSLTSPDEYKTHGYGAATETETFAVNGALWYASFLCENYDVIAIGWST
ncbi:MAG: hypothetical protein IJN25_03480 [Clostridia bacterium]|nr:hypothetical protein [Clostridia bacterium]